MWCMFVDIIYKIYCLFLKCFCLASTQSYGTSFSIIFPSVTFSFILLCHFTLCFALVWWNIIVNVGGCALWSLLILNSFLFIYFFVCLVSIVCSNFIYTSKCTICITHRHTQLHHLKIFVCASRWEKAIDNTYYGITKQMIVF